MAQLDVVLSLGRLKPLGLVDTVFIDDIARIHEVEQRELQGDTVVEIRHLIMIGLDDRSLCHQSVVRLCQCVHRITSDEETRQFHGWQVLMTTCHLSSVKHSQPVVVGKIDHIIVGMQTHAVHVFLHRQTVAAHVSHELLLLLVKLPDTHRGGAPDIAIVRLYDIAYHLGGQRIAIGEALCLLVALVIHEQALVRSDQDIAFFRLTKRIAHLAVEQHIPAIRSEIVFLWVIARHASRRSHPHTALPIGHHRLYPVVVELSSHMVGLCREEVPERMGLWRINTQAARIGRDKELSGAGISHIVQFFTHERHLVLRPACLRVVGIQRLIVTYPVTPLLVAIHELCRWGRSRVCHHVAVLVEAIDAIALNHRPDHSLIAFTD